MLLEDMYLKTSEAFGRKIFSVSQFSKLHGISSQSAKVLLHRLKNNHQAFTVGWGKYVLLSPKHWIMLQQLKKKPTLYRLTITIYEKWPALSLLLLYGSRVRGDADRYSDYDVLLILDKPLDNPAKAKMEIEKKLKIKLHLTVYSRKAFRIFAITEPFLKFWFNEGILFDEASIAMQMTKPTAKLGYLEELQEAKLYLDFLAKEHHPTKRAKYAFTALRILLLLEHAFGLDYKYENIRAELKAQLGDLVKKVRANEAVPKADAARAGYIAAEAFQRVNSKLAMLGENESDLYWKKSRGEIFEP